MSDKTAASWHSRLVEPKPKPATDNKKGLNQLSLMGTGWAEGRYWLTPDQAKRVGFFRAVDGGYQRQPSLRRVAEIRDDLLKRKGLPSNYPEVTIANVDGALQCVDGQHRLLAHIEAGVPIAANILHLTQEEATNMFVRDNWKARPLKRRDLVAGSNDPLAVAIRKISSDTGISLSQATGIVQGLVKHNGLPLGTGRVLSASEKRSLTAAIDIWTAGKLFVPRTAGEVKGRKADVTSHAKCPGRAYSSVVTFIAIGRLCKDNAGDLAKLRKDVLALRSADWKTKAARGLSALTKDTSNTAKAKFYQFIQTEVLLKAYKDAT